MKAPSVLVLVLATLGLAASARADLIYGSIQVGKSALAKHPITITLGDDTYPLSTDEHGSYGVKPKRKGQATLSFSYGGQTLSYTVYSQERPARYDFVLVREGDTWTLKRR